MPICNIHATIHHVQIEEIKFTSLNQLLRASCECADAHHLPGLCPGGEDFVFSEMLLR